MSSRQRNTLKRCQIDVPMAADTTLGKVIDWLIVNGDDEVWITHEKTIEFLRCYRAVTARCPRYNMSYGSLFLRIYNIPTKKNLLEAMVMPQYKA